MTTKVGPLQAQIPIVEMQPDGGMLPSRSFLDFFNKDVLPRIGGSLELSNTELANATSLSDYLETIYPIDGANKTDNAAVFNAKVGITGQLRTINYSRAVLREGGDPYSSRIDLHPSISLEWHARGGVILHAANQMTETVADGGTDSTAQNSLIRILRDAPTDPRTRAWSPTISGFNIDGSKGNQTYPIHGIRIPNPNPTKNQDDGDHQYVTNKDYVAGRYYNQDIANCSGSGWVGEAGNGRADFMSHRSLNNVLHGYDLGGNDIVMHGHWAAGGNGGFGVKVGTAAGFFATTGNIWGNAPTRSATCGAMWINGRKLFAIGFSEFNDWLRLDGNASFYRGGTIGCNVFAQFGTNFTQDGVGVNVLADGDKRLQASVGVTDYQSLNFIGNTHTRTDKCAFATPNNIGGDLTGIHGTAPQYLYDISSNAFVNFIDQVCSAPNVKPWTNTDVAGTGLIESVGDPTPYRARTGAQGNYLLQDSYLSLFRVGAKGAVHSHIALGISEAAFPNLAYQIELGDTSIVAGLPYRNMLYGMWEYEAVTQYTDASFDVRVATNGNLRTIKFGQTYQGLTVAGGGIAGYTIALPNTNTASCFLTIEITGGPISALAVTGTFNANSMPFPAATNGQTTIQLWYRRDSDEWYVLSVSRVGAPFVTLTDAVTVATNAALLGPYRVTLAGNRTLGNPTNMIDGQQFEWKIVQDATGGRTLAYGGKFKWEGGVAPVVSAGVNAVSFIYARYEAATDALYAYGKLGFA